MTAEPAPALGARVLVVQHEQGVPPCRYATLPGAGVHVVRPYTGDALPGDCRGFDGLMVLGGTMAAWEDDVAPWLPASRRLLASAVADGTPTLGICLGAQLLALATGGRVERGASGPELGVVPVTLTADADDDPLARALPSSFLAPQGHRDAVTRLPPDAVLLASSDRYENQLFRVGERAWGVQYHPEVDAATFEDWMRGDAEQLAEQGRTPEEVTAQFREREGELADVAARHASAFAASVRAASAARAAGARR
ncbi:MAG: type 1 glutamine amidotransferase [Actinomycetes bacterium]